MTQAISAKHPLIRAQYEEGRFHEEQVKNWMRELGHEVVDGTMMEDVAHDIDCYIDGVPVSIKCNLPKWFNNSFQFEIRRYTNGTWCDSWYLEGKAEYYLIWKRHEELKGELYKLSKQDVAEYVETNGWDREVGLAPKTKKVQQYSKSKNAHLGCIEKDNAIESGVAKLYAASTEPSIKRLRQTAEELTLEFMGII